MNLTTNEGREQAPIQQPDPLAGKAHTFNAYASGKRSGYGPTPRAAAAAFFEHNPKARKCDVGEGFTDGAFFTCIFGDHVYPGSDVKRWPRSWKGITKKSLGQLPEAAT